jgi:hypothetical protein
MFLPTGVITVDDRKGGQGENQWLIAQSIARTRASRRAIWRAKPKSARKAGKKAKPANKAGPAKKSAAKPKAHRTNKKAEVIAMMKRANGSLADRKHWGWFPDQSVTDARLVILTMCSRPRSERSNDSILLTATGLCDR